MPPGLGLGLSTKPGVKPQRRFRTRWTADGNKEIVLPLMTAGTYDFYVDWGDGTSERVTNSDSTHVSHMTNWCSFQIGENCIVSGHGWKHTYPSSGDYIVTITGKIEGWYSGFSISAHKQHLWRDYLKEVLEWGCLELGPPISSGLGYNFYDCENLVWSATDRLQLGSCTNLRVAFQNCASLGSSGRVNIDTSAVTNMAGMFYGCTDFNMDFDNAFTLDSLSDAEGLKWFLGGDSAGSFTKELPFLSTMDQSQNMGYMFKNQTSYNNPQASDFDMSNCTSIDEMFLNCSAFNQDISDWDVTSLAEDGDNADFMNGANAFSTANYDALLTAWNAQDLNTGISIHFGDATYTGGGSVAAARANMVDSGEHDWTITDGGTA